MSRCEEPCDTICFLESYFLFIWVPDGFFSLSFLNQLFHLAIHGPACVLSICKSGDGEGTEPAHLHSRTVPRVSGEPSSAGSSSPSGNLSCYLPAVRRSEDPRALRKRQKTN